MPNGSAFVNEHLTKENHLTTHMIVSKTPLTPKADNAKFKSYHLGTSVHSNHLSTATTHVEDILPLQQKGPHIPLRDLHEPAKMPHRTSPSIAVVSWWRSVNQLCWARNFTHATLSLNLYPWTPFKKERAKQVHCVILAGGSIFVSVKENKISPQLTSLQDKTE